MKFASVLLLALIAVMSMASGLQKPYYDLRDARQLFEKFIVDYNRHYIDAYDEEIHFEAFKNTLIEINERNARDSAVFDINKFADYTEEEKKMLFGFNPHRRPKY